MPHVELALTHIGPVYLPPPPGSPHSFGSWAAVVSAAVEPSLLIDVDEFVVAVSPSCVTMLGLRKPPIGQPLRGGPLKLIDFSSHGGALTEDEVVKIPPLLALMSGRLARGLIRVECDGSVVTLDAVSTPLGRPPATVGSLTFFSPV